MDIVRTRSDYFSFFEARFLSATATTAMTAITAITMPAMAPLDRPPEVSSLLWSKYTSSGGDFSIFSVQINQFVNNMHPENWLEAILVEQGAILRSQSNPARREIARARAAKITETG